MKSKTLTISMTEEMHEQLRELAVKLTGKRNVSGCIALLVTERLRALESAESMNELRERISQPIWSKK